MTTLADLLSPEARAQLTQATQGTVHDTEVCTCTSRGAKGFTRRDDGLWVHSACMNPTRQYLASRAGRAESVTQVAAEVKPARPVKGFAEDLTEARQDPQFNAEFQRVRDMVLSAQAQRARQSRPLPEPCSECGWQYDADTLAVAAHGEVDLDPTPTHLCQPERVTPDTDVDPRSEALLSAACEDCGEDILVEPTVPEHLAHLPRVFLCADCAQVRVRGMTGTVHTRQPVQTPVQTQTQPKESPVDRQTIDLTTLSDAEIGALVRARLQAQTAQSLPTANTEAKREAQAVEAEAKQARTRRQAQRKNQALAEFAVDKSLTVPALDLSEVTSMDEVVSAALRSPYNKARYRLGAGVPLDPEATTYAVLAAEHVHLAQLAAERRQAKAAAAAERKRAKADKAKPAQTAVVAQVDLDAKAKVAAVMEVLGVSKKEAKRILAGA